MLVMPAPKPALLRYPSVIVSLVGTGQEYLELWWPMFRPAVWAICPAIQPYPHNYPASVHHYIYVNILYLSFDAAPDSIRCERKDSTLIDT